MHVEGICHCGEISFTAEVDPAQVFVCHCTDCQQLSGTAFRVVVPASCESFELRGEPRHYIKIAQSGNRRIQAFCPNCGTPLYAMAAEGASHVNIRVGCVKQRVDLIPRAQIWRRSRLPWLASIPTLPGMVQSAP